MVGVQDYASCGIASGPMVLMPPARDIDAPLKAYSGGLPAIFEKARECRAASGTSDDPAMQPDAQHLWSRATFLEETVDAVAEVFPEFPGTDQPGPRKNLASLASN
jgi:hypothetical protein